MRTMLLGLLAAALVAIAPTPSAHAAGDTFIVFNHGDGVVVRNRTQADQRLKGTSRSFRAAMGSWGHRDDLAVQRYCGVRGGISVEAYLNNRWGLVGGSDCGVIGGTAIFKHKAVGWRRVMGTQEFWDCGQLRRNHVALRILAVASHEYDATHNCFNYEAGHPGNYVP